MTHYFIICTAVYLEPADFSTGWPLIQSFRGTLSWTEISAVLEELQITNRTLYKLETAFLLSQMIRSRQQRVGVLTLKD